jgi:hypothetical protein
VRSLKARLDTGLAALQASVERNTAFAASHLRELGALCQPLLASPISGECHNDGCRLLSYLRAVVSATSVFQHS